MKAKRQPSILTTTICELCSCTFIRKVKASRKLPYRFCSMKCSNTAAAKGTRTYEAMYNKWVERFGEDEAKKRLELNKFKRSKATAKCNTGRILSDSTKQKIAKSCTGISNVLKGKTFEEFYGKERATQLREHHSKKLKEGFASGKISPSARTRVAPIFRGVRLRSKLEQACIEFLEKRDGLKFGTDLLYEDKSVRTTWYDDAGKSHTYTPDLLDTKNNIVYEVKPQWQVDRPTNEMKAKQVSVIRSHKIFCYITDKDLK